MSVYASQSPGPEPTTRIPINDQRYPALLRGIFDPPPMLVARGNIPLLESAAVAVVGTRTPTPWGRRAAYQIARNVAKAGFVVVSGLARGIDAAAHQGALDVAGGTIAVLASSLPDIYPRQHRGLARHIERRGGLLISEFHPNRMTKADFVRRNRIQSGLSFAVVVVECALSGGTMHTVRFATAQGRPVLCPCPQSRIDEASGHNGVQALLRSGRAQAFSIGDTEALIRELPGAWIRNRSESPVGSP